MLAEAAAAKKVEAAAEAEKARSAAAVRRSHQPQKL